MAKTTRAGMARLESREAAHAWLAAAPARALSRPTAAAWPPATPSSPGRATRATAAAIVAAALAAGASACLVEAEGVEAFGFDAEPRVGALRGLKAAAGDIASRFLAAPSEKLDVVAVTGTNGKTSTAWWVAQALAALGRRCRRHRHARDRRAAARPHGGRRTAARRRRGRRARGDALDRIDDARPGDAAERAARLRRARLRRLRRRGLVDRHRRAPPRRHPGRRGGLHQLHAGPPRLPRRHARLLAGEGAAVRLARAARGGRQPRRRARARARRVARRRCDRPLDGVDARRAGSPARRGAAP